jgi:hypothetical protein
MTAYSTLLDAIKGLTVEGYSEDFNLQRGNKKYNMLRDEFVIDKYYRFDENSDPSDQSIIYAISLVKDGLKGILVNGYGIYSEPLTNEILAKSILTPGA